MNILDSKLFSEGFKIFPQKIDASIINPVINDLLTLVNQLLKKYGKSNEQDLGLGLRKLASYNLKSYLSLLKSSEHLQSIYRLAFSKPLLDIQKKYFGHNNCILSVNPRIHLMDKIINDILSKNDGYSETPWHQDWPPIQTGLNALSVWIPIVSGGKNNYSLDIIPGSHKNGLMKFTTHKFGHKISPDIQENKNKIISLNLNSGDVFIFSMFLVHRTGISSNADKTRISLGFRYTDIKDDYFIRSNYNRPLSTIVNYEVPDHTEPSLEEIEKASLGWVKKNKT